MGTFGSKLLTFLMVRFYTGILTPEDYGTADLIMQTANLLFPVVSLGITSGVFRFALEKTEDRKSVFSAGCYTVTAGGLLLAAAIALLPVRGVFDEYAELIVCYTIASCYHSLCAQFIRAEGKIRLFARQGILNTVMVIGLNILFLAVFRLGITGYVLSVVLADGLCSLHLFGRERLWKMLTLHPETRLFNRMLRYSIPLIPTTIFWWITSVSDRYMIAAFLGREDTGIYAVAYKIPTLLTLLSGIFLEAWQFSAVAEAKDDRNAHIHFYSRIWSSFQSVMFLAGSVVIAFSRIEIRLLSTEAYEEAWQYVPMLSAAMIFSAFASFMGSVYMVEKKSGLSFWTSMVGGVSNIVLNFLLIPAFGTQGAALATLISYLLSFGIRAVSGRRLLPFRLYTGRLIGNTLILALQVLAMTANLPMCYPLQIGCLLLLLMLNKQSIYGTIVKMKDLRKEKGANKK